MATKRKNGKGSFSAAQCRMARGGLRMTIEELAEAAGVSPTTVVRFEAERGRTNQTTRDALRRVLETAGAEFVDDGAVRLKKTD
jgi:DNA-binding XRE family transcriptional regulator